MYKNLRCPNCGFSFGLGYPDDEPPESLNELMTCPCGTLMVEVEELTPIALREEDEDAED